MLSPRSTTFVSDLHAMAELSTNPVSPWGEPVAAAVANVPDSAGEHAQSVSKFILGMRVDATSYAAATELITGWAAQAESRCVIEVPVNAVMESYDDPRFRKVINNADLVVPGGVPIVWMLRALGLKSQQRVYGPELMLHVCEAAARHELPIGLYGGSERALDRLQTQLRSHYPGLPIAYACSPPFRPPTPEEEANTLSEIRQSGCRVLFVGLGCPKQERWMARQRGKLPAVMLGVGAAFDFLSGEKPRPFPWMQAMGLEWLFRWVTEPRRLFFRYAYHNPRFIVLAACQLLLACWPKELRPRAAHMAQIGQPMEDDALEERLELRFEESLRQKRIYQILKRAIDVTGAVILLPLLAPVLLVIGGLVAATSSGPVIFRQSRAGYRGREFTMYKFRTMRQEDRAEAPAAKGHPSGRGILVKGKRDPRVTPVGRFLRATSLDELPQVFNVLKGEMSFVGPRPLLSFMLAPYPEFARTRALVRPGITGLWQVRDRENNTSAEAMRLHDLEYISQFSLRSDLAILWRTLFVVVAGNGAC